MTPNTSRRLLQVTIVVLGLVPILAGAAGVVNGPAFVMAAATSWPAELDSHFRYLSGIFLGVGAMFYATVPSIARKTVLFRCAAALVVTGGLARTISLVAVGPPAIPHLVGLALELVVVPLLVVWQARVARAAAGS